MAKTKAEIQAELDAVNREFRTVKSQRDSLVEGVMNYSGCYDGKVSFLEECGVDVPVQELYFDVTLRVVASEIGAAVSTVQSEIENYIEEAIREQFNGYSTEIYGSGDYFNITLDAEKLSVIAQ